ncbi:HTTM domain-containing protein [Haliangium sp.]|uniref:HTTM domain-containing protein n=1 Tax=Haliangium sp. TaxID=2663208 RepID=UPI003D0CD63F
MKSSQPASPVQRIEGLVAVELDPFVLGLYRVALGCFVLLFYSVLAPSWRFYYGAGGISPYLHWPAPDYELLVPILVYARSDALLWALYGVSVLAALMLAAGVWWRLAALWLWHMNLGILYGNPYAANGEEQVMCLLLAFALFMPLGAALTLPGRRRARADTAPTPAKVRVWPLRALQLHLMLVYLLSVPLKLGSDPAWRDGTVVYYATMALDYPRWPGLEIFAWGDAALSRALTCFALAVEALVPVLIWFRRLRPACLLAAAGLHIGMALLLEGVAMFNGAMMVGLVLFLPSAHTRAWVSRLAHRPQVTTTPR